MCTIKEELLLIEVKKTLKGKTFLCERFPEGCKNCNNIIFFDGIGEGNLEKALAIFNPKE